MGNYQNTRHRKGPREMVTGGERLLDGIPAVDPLAPGHEFAGALVVSRVLVVAHQTPE